MRDHTGDDEVKLTRNAMKVLERRYLLRNGEGQIIESPLQMFARVAEAVDAGRGHRDEFLNAMKNLLFLPNSPTLMNASTPLGQLSACFVLPIHDSLNSIFTSFKEMALIQQSGGGTGFSFSHLRPKGDVVRSTSGVASGPLSFIRIFDATTDVIKQGGRRRGANMAVLNASHPDIEEFIRAKARGGFTNFNFSVGVDDAFMRAVEEKREYPLVNPRSGEITETIDAESLWNLLAEKAWECGDPGVIFLDEINRHNPLPKLGRIEATNPCGEQPLLPHESCNLGSINLSKVVKKNEIDWELLSELVHIGTRFLDFTIDVNRFPIQKIAEKTRANRKIGLGVMGFADMLAQLAIPYESTEALSVAEEIMREIQEHAEEESRELAERYGDYPNIDRGVHKGNRRNATLTTIAPTGTISIIAGSSSGIEPIFAVSFIRRILNGAELREINPYFKKLARELGFYSNALIERIAETGSIAGIPEVPRDIKELFKTAIEIPPEAHVKIQAAFQRHTENSVSKTINLPQNASVEDVKEAYSMAYRLKCKGITVFRYGSKGEQVLHLKEPPLTVDPEYTSCRSTRCIY
ncbi:MAG: adenosylcobalamin-dependent ribonucleoside-diphosphate reductase [Methanosarcinales archaeon]